MHPKKLTLFPVPAQPESTAGDRCCSNLTLGISRQKCQMGPPNIGEVWPVV